MPTPSLLDKHFPRYTNFDPKVPVWCITPGEGRAIHRFFDTSPISPSGRYAAVFRLPREDRRPELGDIGRVSVIDLDTGAEIYTAETAGFESQMGANINWGGSDRELFFNDVDAAVCSGGAVCRPVASCSGGAVCRPTHRPFAWNCDPLSGTRRAMQGTVYHASPDGRFLISANLANSGRTQPGYGVLVPQSSVRRNIGPVEDDGFYLTDTHTGETRLLVSLAELMRRAAPPALFSDPAHYEFYGFHSKFNPQGDRVMVSVRAFPAAPEPRWDMFNGHHDDIEFAWFTLDLEAREIHCAVGPEKWKLGGHHATFFPDGRRISMNINLTPGDYKLRLMQVNLDGSDFRQIRDGLIGSGHPTVVAGGANRPGEPHHIITDSYEGEPVAFGDGTVPLRWINLRDGTEECLIRVNVRQPCPDGAMRIDPHPAWDRTNRWLTFNGFVDGTRRVFLAQIS
ncbi:MAG: hypothetical protein FWG05_00260 [Kiritimatiellaeota bacterium]|nr:hypothetical protein [Kiritimatiellota bacterium]